VVAAKGSCLEEAGGPHSLYVYPDDVQGMATTLNRLIGDVQLRMSMIEEGKKYALRFSEEEQARQLLDIYRLNRLRK
jgi:glycosyltransferase involved in cell wall biosynthesis